MSDDSSIIGDALQIHRPATFVCLCGNRKLPEDKPDWLAIDDALWEDFVERLNPLVAKLNRGNMTGLLLILLLFIGTTTAAFLSPVEIYYVPVMVIASMYSFLTYVWYENSKIDQQIKEALSDPEIAPRLASEGYIVHYVKKNTSCSSVYMTRVGSNQKIVERWLDFRFFRRDRSLSSGSLSSKGSRGKRDTTAATANSEVNFSSTTNNDSEAGTPSNATGSAEDSGYDPYAKYDNAPSANDSDAGTPAIASGSEDYDPYDAVGAPSAVDQMMADLQRPL